MLNIITGRVQRPQKVVLYGVEGIGKTSLAAQTPDPLFIDTEGGTACYDVKRAEPAPTSWAMLMAYVDEAARGTAPCSTLVIDTADWAERLCIAKVLADSPAVVVLNEPTQGVDVGARQEIYDCIARLASSGLAILLVSSDLPELLGLCRRILVMRAGRIAGEVSGDDLNERAIIRLATGTA